MCLIKKPAIDEEYGPNNPEPLAMKDSASVRDPARDSLHAALEYIDRTQIADSE